MTRDVPEHSLDREPNPASPNWLARLGKLLHPSVSQEREDAKRLHKIPELLSPPLTADELDSRKASYLRFLQERYGTLPMYGLDARRRALQESGHRLDLLSIYTPLNTTLQTTIDQEIGANAGTLKVGEPRTRPRALIEVAGREPRLIVRGLHGSGKSTFACFVALALAESWLSEPESEPARLGVGWAHGRLFPLLINLRDFAEHAAGNDTVDDLCAYVAAQLDLVPDQMQHQLILPGGILFLLDGIGMAPRATTDLVIRFANTPNCFFVTGQTYVNPDALGAPLDAFARVELARWEMDQMDAFVRRWYAELERKEWIDAEAARDLPGQLCSALRREEIGSLAGRPSLMTIISLLHTIKERLPADRMMLYRELMDLTVAYWSEGRPLERDLRQVFDPENLRMAVAETTFHAYSRLQGDDKLVELSESDLRATLVNICQDQRWEAVSDLVMRILTRPGLLDEQSPGLYTYPHPSLQAFIVSRHLTSLPELPRRVVQLAKENFYRWREVILFAIARLDRLDQDRSAALAVIDALCPDSLSPVTERHTSNIEWYLAWLAGEALIGILEASASPLAPILPSSQKPKTPSGPAEQITDRVRAWLSALLDRGRLSPRERVQVGSVLDRLGDPRPGICLPMPLFCQVEAGSFWQGEDDQPHLVHLQTFWIGRYPVTNAQYAHFVGATRHPAPCHWQGDRPLIGTGNHPVVNVTWQDAMAYCQWCAERLPAIKLALWQPEQVQEFDHAPPSWTVRLPTSAEWEKAARGGLQIHIPPEPSPQDNAMPRRIYPWGDTWRLSIEGNPGDETRCNVSESDIGTTTPVGMYPRGASPYGAMDMAGNVWEWSLDWSDPEHRYKIRRGGAFRYTHEHARCAASDKAHPGLAWPYLGFRIVLAPPQPG